VDVALQVTPDRNAILCGTGDSRIPHSSLPPIISPPTSSAVMPSRRSRCDLAAELRRGARRVFCLFRAGLIAVALDFRYALTKPGTVSSGPARQPS